MDRHKVFIGNLIAGREESQLAQGAINVQVFAGRMSRATRREECRKTNVPDGIRTVRREAPAE